MSDDWESTFRFWMRPPSATERTKSDNAERMIRDAIREDPTLSARRIQVFAQGSYKNNTNVREESDVDICVRCMDTFFYDFTMAVGFSPQDVGFPESDYSYWQYKQDVEGALIAKFGQFAVTRGNKAFEIHENTYHLNADVVACFEHRRYTHKGFLENYLYDSGTELLSDQGARIINWPVQHHANGVQKNTLTFGRFKDITRILKRLRHEMEDQHALWFDMPSYLIESLAYNVPDRWLGPPAYTTAVRNVLYVAFNETLPAGNWQQWVEVNDLKYLFSDGQPWTRELANTFLGAAWQYVGFS